MKRFIQSHSPGITRLAAETLRWPPSSTSAMADYENARPGLDKKARKTPAYPHAGRPIRTGIGTRARQRTAVELNGARISRHRRDGRATSRRLPIHLEVAGAGPDGLAKQEMKKGDARPPSISTCAAKGNRPYLPRSRQTMTPRKMDEWE